MSPLIAEQKSIITRAVILDGAILVGWGYILWVAITTMGSGMGLSALGLLGSLAVAYVVSSIYMRAEMKIRSMERKAQGVRAKI